MTRALMRHQKQAIAASLAAWQMEGVQRQVITLPTGGGKTVTACALAGRVLAESDEPAPRLIWLAHRDKLVEQAHDELRSWLPPGSLGMVRGPHDQPGRRHIVASVQTLAQPNRLAAVLAWGKPALIITDEAHHAPAESWKEVLRQLYDPESTLLVGLTATPSRADGISLRGVFERLVYSIGMLELICAEPPVLVDLRRINALLPDVALADAVEEGTLDGYNTSKLAAHTRESIERGTKHRAALDVLLGYPELRGRRGIYFGLNKRDARGFAELASAAGVPTAVVLGETEEEERRDTYARFVRGEIRFLSSVDVLTEGADFPEAEIAIIGRHTKSSERYAQMIGRVARIHPADRGRPREDWVKPCGWVVDLCDNDHTVMTLDDFIGVEGDALTRKSVREVAKEQGLDEPPPPPPAPVYTPGTEHVRLARTSLFTGQPWRRSGMDYVLSTPHGEYRATPTFGDVRKFETYFTDMVGQERKLSGTKPVEIEHALAFGEQHLHRVQQREARRSDPQTRRLPVTEGQLIALQRIWPMFYGKAGEPAKRPITQGEYQTKMDELKAAGSPRAWWAQFKQQQAARGRK